MPMGFRYQHFDDFELVGATPVLVPRISMRRPVRNIVQTIEIMVCGRQIILPDGKTALPSLRVFH